MGQRKIVLHVGAGPNRKVKMKESHWQVKRFVLTASSRATLVGAALTPQLELAAVAAAVAAALAVAAAAAPAVAAALWSLVVLLVVVMRLVVVVLVLRPFYLAK